MLVAFSAWQYTHPKRRAFEGKRRSGTKGGHREAQHLYNEDIDR